MHGAPIRGPVATIVWACAIAIISMLVLSSYPALIPTLQTEWGLTNVEAGTINGLFFGGQLVTVAAVTMLSDRFDAKGMYLGFLAMGGVAALGFAAFADSFALGAALRFAEGVALGGTYIPGLRILTDNVPETHRSRATSFYTASYFLAAGLSFFLALWIAPMAGWRWAMAACGAGPLVACLLALFVVPKPPRHGTAPTRLFDLRPAFRNRRAVGFSLLYGLHNAELAVFSSWLVPFLAFSRSLDPGHGGGLDLATIAALVSIIALPASICGNEVAHKIGRQVLIITVSLASALAAIAFGLAPMVAYGVVIAAAFFYSAMIAFDSSAITGGMLATADPTRKGATMALYAIIGFGCAGMGPPLFGLALDVAGGQQVHMAWIVAFGCVAAVILVQPLLVWRVVRGPLIRD
jgi:predicted MFS family arabinose efflux permease